MIQTSRSRLTAIEMRKVSPIGRQWTRGVAAAAFWFVLVGVEPHAFAEQKSGGTISSARDDSKLLARDLMRQGVEAYRKNNLEGARASFAKAWELEQHSAIAASLADVEVRLGRYREAAEHWSFYLKNAPPDRDRTDAQNGLAECRKHVARLAVTTDSNATVSVDGHTAGGDSPQAEFWLDPGAHVIEVRPATGGAAAAQQVTLAAGEEKQIALTPPGPGVPNLPPAETTAAPTAPPSTQSQSHAAQSGVSTRSTVVITGSTLTVVAAVVGVVYGLKAQRASDDADALTARINMGASDALVGAKRACNPPSGEPSNDCGPLGEKVDAARGARTTSQVAFVAAGALGIGTLAALLFWPAPGSTGARGLVIAPWQTGNLYGLVAQGSY